VVEGIAGSISFAVIVVVLVDGAGCAAAASGNGRQKSGEQRAEVKIKNEIRNFKL
jgi:hypothetical protein